MTENSPAQKKRIAILSGIQPPDIGGPASFIKNVVPSLAEDYEIRLVAYSSQRIVATDAHLPYKPVRVWSGMPKLIRHAVYMIQCLRAAYGADLVICLSAMNAGIAGAFASRIYKIPMIVRVVGDYAWEHGTNFQITSLGLDDFQKIPKTGWLKILHRIQVAVCNQAQVIIVPSKYLRKIVSGWGVSEDKITVVHNGVHPMSSNLTQEQARVKIGVSGRIILSIGRLVSWKGFRMLIKIMPTLLQWDQYTRLIIIGEGPDEQLLRSMVHNMGLERKVFIVGRKSHAELADYLRAADVFVLHTGYEGFSHQLVEVMSAGVPVITTDIGGNPEIVQHGKNGFLVNYNDEFELVESIRSVLQSESLRDQFLIEGHKTAVQFSVKRMVQGVRDIIGRHVSK